MDTIYCITKRFGNEYILAGWRRLGSSLQPASGGQGASNAVAILCAKDHHSSWNFQAR